jgi:uncharacterized membrane protein YeaQ/YmgE (transglycosylase-associated protein family)
MPCLLLSMLVDAGGSITVSVRTLGFFMWIVVGLLAGWIAGHLTRGRGFGCVLNVILGLIGAVIGGWVFTRLGITTWGFWGSLASATVGAVLLVAIARLFAGQHSE